MKFNARALSGCVVFLATMLSPLSSGAATVNFEQFSDGQFVTSQIGGLTLSNAVILEAGNSLNEFDFPPRSGIKVLSDAGGVLSALFDSDISLFSAYFTYATALTLRGYRADGTLVATAASLFGTNGALSGDAGSSPNELLTLDFAGGIRRVEVLGFVGGGSFAMDDLTYLPATTTGHVPEPATVLLAAAAFLAMTSVRRRSPKPS
jgi:hypothetical protein